MRKRMKLVKFGAEWCGPCRSMARAGTLEKFVKAHPDIGLEVVDVDVDSKRADEFRIRSIPTFVFVDLSKEEGILHKAAGATDEAGLEKMYKKASKALEEEDDEDDEDEDDGKDEEDDEHDEG